MTEGDGDDVTEVFEELDRTEEGVVDGFGFRVMDVELSSDVVVGFVATEVGTVEGGKAAACRGV